MSCCWGRTAGLRRKPDELLLGKNSWPQERARCPAAGEEQLATGGSQMSCCWGRKAGLRRELDKLLLGKKSWHQERAR